MIDDPLAHKAPLELAADYEARDNGRGAQKRTMVKSYERTIVTSRWRQHLWRSLAYPRTLIYQFVSTGNDECLLDLPSLSGQQVGVASYRLFFIGHDKHIVRAEVVNCETDDDAIAAARLACREYRAVEIWQLDRQVAVTDGRHGLEAIFQ